LWEERLSMKANDRTACDKDGFLDHFAAELTEVAYPIALRHRRGDSWIDLELDLWKALAETVRKWAGHLPTDGCADEFVVNQSPPPPESKEAGLTR
jgi:hypothetical protein